MLIYLAFIIIFIFAMFTAENFAYPENEVIFISLVTVLGLAAIFYSYKNQLELHKVALVMIIVFGLLMVFFTPPMSFPDEGSHFTRAELITEGVLYPEITEKGVLVDDYYFDLNQAYNGVTILSENNFHTQINDHQGYWGTTTTSPFYAYLASAIGIGIAKILHLTALWALYFARMANLIFYGAVAYFMIRSVSRFKLPLLVISTMPFCISQASSSSYDAFILTFTLVILAYFIRMYCGEVNDKNLAIFFASVLLISLIKPPYVMLAFLIFAVPDLEKKYLKYSIASIFIVFILTLLGVSSIFASLFTTTAVHTIDTGTVSNVSFVGQTRFVLSNPLIIISLIKDMLISVPTVFILKSNFFHYTGFKGIKLINLMYVLFFIGFSLFYKMDIDLNRKQRSILALIFLIVYGGIYAILYLQWSPVGSNVTLGIQARYFLPVIMLLPLIINTKYRQIENMDIYIFTFIIICLTGLFMLPITHYY